jgi:hypothetical protein
MNTQIANWESLTDDQKKNAEALLKGNPGLNAATVHPAAKYFEEHGWVKIDNFIDRNMANLMYHHVQLETARLNYLDESLGKGNYDKIILVPLLMNKLLVTSVNMGNLFLILF